MSIDKIRSATIGGSKKPRSRMVNVNGVEVEVRQMSYAMRKEVVQRATTEKADGTSRIDAVDFQLWMVIYGTFDPETKKQVFADTDYADLMGHPTGGWLDDLSRAVSDLNGGTEAQAVKNFVQTQNESSSSESPKSSEAAA